MSKKKIEVETSDGQSAILDLALTKTTGQVLLAAGLGLLSGLVAGKVVGDRDSSKQDLADKIAELQSKLNNIVPEDGVHKEHVDAAVAEWKSKVDSLKADVDALNASLGQRPTKAQLDEVRAELTNRLNAALREAEVHLSTIADLQSDNSRLEADVQRVSERLAMVEANTNQLAGDVLDVFVRPRNLDNVYASHDSLNRARTSDEKLALAMSIVNGTKDSKEFSVSALIEKLSRRPVYGYMGSTYAYGAAFIHHVAVSIAEAENFKNFGFGGYTFPFHADARVMFTYNTEDGVVKRSNFQSEYFSGYDRMGYVKLTTQDGVESVFNLAMRKQAFGYLMQILNSLEDYYEGGVRLDVTSNQVVARRAIKDFVSMVRSTNGVVDMNETIRSNESVVFTEDMRFITALLATDATVDITPFVRGEDV